MSLSNGILSKPITIAEVAQCLGVSSQDLGTLCTSSQINMWAKYKPVKRNSYSELTEDERKGVGYGVKATTIDVDSASGRQDALNNAVAGNTGWYHEKPVNNTGGGNQYRLIDFNGYNDNAVNPFTFSKLADNALYIRINIGQRGSLPSGNMNITDITGIIGLDDVSKTGYGLILRHGSNYRHVDAINSGGTGVVYPISTSHTIQLDNYPAGDWDVCAYLRDLNTGTAVLVPVPALQVTVIVEPDDVEITASLTQQSASKSEFDFTITGKRSTGVSSGTARLNVYGANGNLLEFYNFSIPYLSYNQSYSPTLPETIDIPYSSIGSWTFSYSGVEVSGTT